MNLADSIENMGIGADDNNLEQLQAVLNRYCLSLTRSSWDAEDLAQDTWLKAIGMLKAQRHRNPEAFLLRVAKNTWIDQSRRKKVLTRLLKQERPKVTLPDNDLFEIESAFQSLMQHLSPLQRTVFLLRDVFDYSIGETAEILETTEGAVKAALHRARQSLENVKVDLEKGTLPIPETEDVKTLLQSLAVAYQKGDIGTLMELSLRREVEPVIIKAIAQGWLLRKSPSNGFAENWPNAQMAA